MEEVEVVVEEKVVRTRLETPQVPSDFTNKLFGVRKPLVALYNRKRTDEEAMAALKKLLLVVLFKITGEVYAAPVTKEVKSRGTKAKTS